MLLVVFISAYWLSQSNSIFVGLAETECSLLKFIGEVLDGETKEIKPIGVGINEIKGLLQKTINQISGLTTTTENTLSSNKVSANDAFPKILKEVFIFFNTSSFSLSFSE